MKEELGEKLIQVPIGTTLGAGTMYLSWKYPGYMHKLVWDKAVERALIKFGQASQWGAYYTADEVSEAIFARWVTRTTAGKIVGFSARMLGRALMVYAIYDTVKLSYDIGRIYGGHLESATGGISGDPASQQAFAETHHRPGLMRN